MLKITGFILMITLNAIILNKSIILNKVVKINSYFFSVILIILSLPIIHVQNYWVPTFVNLLLILVYGELIEFNDVNHKKKRIFNSGLLIGMMGLVDYNLNYFYVIILLALFYYKVFNWKNFMIQILGWVSPLILSASLILLEYIPNKSAYKVNESLQNTHLFFYEYPIMLIVTGLLLIPSTWELYNNYYRKTESAKKAFGLLLIITIVILLHSIIIMSFKFAYLLNLVVTIIMVNYLIYLKSLKFRTFLLGLLLISFLLNFL